jgi:hypothetical protein
MEFVNENTPPLIKNTGGRAPKYNWDAWLRHNHTVRLVEGEDFDCAATSMRMMSYNQAKRRGGKVSVSIGLDILSRNVVEITFQLTETTIKRRERELRVAGTETELLDDAAIVSGKWGPAKTFEEPDLFPQGVAKAPRED